MGFNLARHRAIASNGLWKPGLVAGLLFLSMSAAQALCVTATAPVPATVTYSPNAQSIVLEARVTRTGANSGGGVGCVAGDNVNISVVTFTGSGLTTTVPDPGVGNVGGIHRATVSIAGGTPAGASPVLASYSGSPGNDPSSASTTLTISKASQTIGFPNPGTQTLPGPVTLAATASSTLPVSYASATGSVCTVSGNSLTLIAPGTCSITASQAGDGNYNAAIPVTQSFTVTPGTNVITFPALANAPLTGPAPTPAATASSGLPISYASSTGGVCTISGSTITLVAAGTCSITASQPGNANYAAATPVTQSFAVTPGTNVITFPALANAPVTGPAPTPAATASSGLPISYASSTGGVCTIAGSTITLIAAGTCSITATQPGNANYAAATPVTQSFTVTPGTNVITFPALANAPLTGPAPTPAATATSGLQISYTSSTGGVCTIAGSTITLIAAGTCSITASQPGNANYAAATPVTQSFTVTPGTNVITFPAIANAPVTGPAPTPAATASSGLPISYASSTAGVCTIAGSTITLVAAGTCSITATQPGNANYAAATPVTQSFTVTPGTNVITFPALANAPVTGPAPTLAATASSGLPVSYASSTGGICTIAGSTITLVAAGTCSITATQPGNANYAAATPVTQSFTVTPGANVITFPALANAPVTGPAPTPAATASSGLPVSYASSTAGVCTIAGSTITLIAAGTCSITASQPGNANYAAATPVTQSFAVTPGTNVITFPALANAPVTGPAPTPAATASSGLAVSYASSTAGVCTIAGSTITLIAAGTCSITATQPGNANYAAAAPVTQGFTVTPGTNVITFPALANAPLTGPAPTPAATASSGLPVSYASSTAGVCTITGSTITLVAAGTCSITATQPGNANYAAATPVTQSFTVTPGTNVITFPALPNAPVTGPAPTPAATASSGLPVSYASSTASVCTISGSTITLVSAGTCSITASQPGNANYAAATPVTQSFAVTPGTNVITFPALANAPVTGPAPTPAATASSGLPVSYASSTAGVCTIAGSTITLVAAGTCSITATQPGNANYAAATPVTQSFTVTPGTNVITFPALANAPVTGPAPTPAATASSGLAVSYASSTAGVCTIAGSTITLVAAGTCSITASQPGNANYAAATPVTQSFAVTPGTNVITFPALANAPVTGPAPTPAATATSGLAVSYASSTAGVCTIAGSTITLIAAGTCSITATQPGNANYAAATPVTQSFTVTPGTNVITFPALANAPVTGPAPTPAATASSGLPISYASSTGGVCTIAGSTITLVAAGTCSITASQPGNANYAAAAPVTQSFQASRAMTTVTLTASTISAVRGAPVNLTARVTGAVPTGTVTFFDGGTSLGTVAVAGGLATRTVTFATGGTHTITASYSGDGNNSPSTSTSVAVVVNERPDPSLDPDVRGILQSQVTSSQRFAETQIENISRRLERLHADGCSDPVEMGIGVSTPDGLPAPVASVLNDPARRSSNPTFNNNNAYERPVSAAPSRKGGCAPVSIWAGGGLSFGSQLPNGIIENRFTTGGVTLGADGRMSDNVKAGFALGFGTDESKIGTNGARTQARNANAALYASYRILPSLFLDAIAGYGGGYIDSQRLTFDGPLMARGHRDAAQLFGSIALVHEARFGAFQYAPYVRLDAARLTFDRYAETGPTLAALSFDPLVVQTLRGVAGMRASYDIPMSWGTLTAIGRLEYRARLDGNYTQILRYADSANGPLYSISQQALTRGETMMAVGLRAKTDGVGIDLEYQYRTTNTNLQSSAIRGAVRFGF